MAASPMAGQFPRIKQLLQSGGKRMEAEQCLKHVHEAVDLNGRMPWDDAFVYRLWLGEVGAFQPQGALSTADHVKLDAAGIRARQKQERIMTSLDAYELFRYKQIPRSIRMDLPHFMQEWEKREESRVLAQWQKQERIRISELLAPSAKKQQ